MLFEDLFIERLRDELLEESVGVSPDTKVTATLPDRYVAMSLLQKSVRRGELGLAWMAGRYLLAESPTALWKRLAIISLEDVGVADITTVTKVLLICSDATLRKNLGCVRSASHAIKLLVEAPKDRSTDDLLELLLRDPEIREMRANIAERSLSAMEQPLEGRIDSVLRMAMRLLSDAGEMELGDYQAGRTAPWFHAISQMPESSVLPGFKQSSILGLRRTRSLLAPMMAVLAPFLPEQPGSGEDQLLPESFVEGVPTWALGQHTRVGLDGFRKYVSRSRKIKSLLSVAATGEVSKSKIIGGLVFRLDCGKLRNRIDWAIGFDLEARATKLGWGILDEHVCEALEIIQSEWQLLNDCRCDALCNYLR